MLFLQIKVTVFLIYRQIFLNFLLLEITGNKISIDSSGMAINGTDYYILEKTKDYDGDYGIVQILFK